MSLSGAAGAALTIGPRSVGLPADMPVILVQIIYFGSLLSAPLALVAGWLAWRARGARRWSFAVLSLVAALAAYARLVEPKLLFVHHEDVTLAGADMAGDTLRIAVVGDMHVGILRSGVDWPQVVDAINAARPDLVFLVGDYAYLSGYQRGPGGLEVAGGIAAPTFAVLGNHDVGINDLDLTREMTAAISRTDIVLVDNAWRSVRVRGRDIVVAGLSELWLGGQAYGFGKDLPDDLPIFLLAHNPDTAAYVPPTLRYDLLLAGHTHGGQVRLPLMWEAWTPTDLPFSRGLYAFPGKLQPRRPWRVKAPTPGMSNPDPRLVYVTPGVGMSYAPFRFLSPPRIDLLSVRLPPVRSASVR